MTHVNMNVTVTGTQNGKKGHYSDMSRDEHNIQYVLVQGSTLKDML